CVLSLTLSGCSMLRYGVSLSPDQQTLLTKCPKVPAQLTDGTGADVAIVIKETASVYHDCATRHNGLVDAVERIME
uniref:hypothetical protein n=1 Tax=Marinobacter sp. TaxID=50741 RepID=UPI0035698DE9